MAQPGIDTRTWCTAGRVVEEDGAVRWDSEIGWILDIEAQGELYGNELRTRVGGPDCYGSVPIPEGSEWVVCIPDGDASMNPVAMLRTPNATCAVPAEVAGHAVDGSSETSASSMTADAGTISPWDTEFRASPWNYRASFGGYYFVSAPEAAIEADDLRLGTRDADQSYVRGEDFAEAVTAAVEALIPKLIGNMGAPVLLPPTWPVTDRLLFKQTLLDALSETIKGV
jgi:hypothetical protein